MQRAQHPLRDRGDSDAAVRDEHVRPVRGGAGRGHADPVRTRQLDASVRPGRAGRPADARVGVLRRPDRARRRSGRPQTAEAMRGARRDRFDDRRSTGWGRPGSWRWKPPGGRSSTRRRRPRPPARSRRPRRSGRSAPTCRMLQATADRGRGSDRARRAERDRSSRRWPRPMPAAGGEYFATNTVCSGPNTNPWRAEATDRAIADGRPGVRRHRHGGDRRRLLLRLADVPRAASRRPAQRQTYRAAVSTGSTEMKALVRPGITCGELAERAPLPARALPRPALRVHGPRRRASRRRTPACATPSTGNPTAIA